MNASGDAGPSTGSERNDRPINNQPAEEIGGLFLKKIASSLTARTPWVLGLGFEFLSNP